MLIYEIIEFPAWFQRLAHIVMIYNSPSKIRRRGSFYAINSVCNLTFDTSFWKLLSIKHV